jgi:cytidylate kinase
VIVTIDGPAGSGKSTTAVRVAERLGYVYLDTGAMYRTLALGVLRAGVSPDTDEIEDVLPRLEIRVRYEGDSMHVFLDGEDVTGRIRTSEVGDMASQISSLEPVRRRLVRDQRRIGFRQEERHGGVILDGRDTGTVVFPEADVKIFMVADVDERAARRLEEYRKAGRDPSLADVRAEIEERDRRDRNRDIAPLRQAEDAITLDTTERTIEDQVAFVVDRVKAQADSGTSGHDAE